MKGKKVKLWTALAFCIALAATAWPVSAHFAEAEENTRQVESIEKCVAALGEGQLSQYRELAKWYNHQLEQGNEALRGIYPQILELGEGRMGVLVVPELCLELPIYHGYEGKVGHDPGTPLPIGGRGNHTVLILAEAYSWAADQAVYIDILGQRLCYRVENVQVMPAGWSPERPTEAGQDLLTFVFDRGNTRTIIRCVRCADLMVRRAHTPAPGHLILAAIWPLALFLPAFGWSRIWEAGEQKPRICGFHRENPEKSNLF